MKLQRDAVIETALRLLDEVGVDGLSTRRLAAELGVQQPALYWHFRNKRALLDALAEAMLARNHAHSLPRAGDNWRAFLEGNARSFRKALLSHRDGARIHAGTVPERPKFEMAEAQLRFLTDQGFEPPTALHALLTVSYYVVGSVLEEQSEMADSAERQPVAQEGMPLLLAASYASFRRGGREAVFEAGLSIILDGLAAQRKADREHP